MKKSFLLSFVIFISCTHNPTGIEYGDWEMIRSSQSDGYYHAIFFTDKNNGCVVGDSGKIIYTNDGGNTWKVQHGGTKQNLRAVHFVNRQIGWAVGYNNTIISTTDGGNSWQLHTISNDSAQHYLGVYFVDNQAGWVFNNHGEIFHTQNAGVSWELQIQDPKIHLSQIFFVDRYTGFAVSIFPEVLLKTTNGGINWQRYELDVRWPTDIFFVDEQRGWIVTTTVFSSMIEKGSPVFRANDGGLSWTCQDTLPDLHLNTIHFIDKQSGWVAGQHKIFHTLDGGVTWKETLNADKVVVDLSFVDESHGWALGFQGEVFRYGR